VAERVASAAGGDGTCDGWRVSRLPARGPQHTAPPVPPEAAACCCCA